MLAVLLPWLQLSLRAPRKAMRALLALNWDVQTSAIFFGAAFAASVAITGVENLVLSQALAPEMQLPPMTLLVVLGALGVQLALIFVQYLLSQLAQGKAEPKHYLLLSGWLQAVMIIPELGLTLIRLILPNASMMAAVTLSVATIVYLVAGLAEINRFGGWGKALGIAVVSACLVVSIGISMFGLAV